MNGEAAWLVWSALAVVSCGVLGFLYVWWDESRQPRLTCLMYHRFVTTDEHERLSGTERTFSVSTDLFEAQLNYLARGGFRTLTMAEAVRFLHGHLDFLEPGVLITIDDGARSVLTMAEPLLAARRQRAILYVTTDPAAYVFASKGPEQRRLSDEELRRLDPGVIEIGAHGVTHRPLRSLTDDELDHELRESRAELEHLTGRSVRHMAIPGNWYDGRVLARARAAGYETVCVSDAGGNRPGRSPFRIRRINVEGGSDLGAFAASLRPLGAAQRRFVSSLKRIPGRLLGPRVWMPIRGVVRAVLPSSLLSFRGIMVILTIAAAATVGLWLTWRAR